ncbi:hypothetical protein Btru_040057 [Bulinus truncatus]|nr:hypothetical protein Btru_040057 [Bulinus truncatus]
MPLDDTVQQLRRLKAQRSRQRELRDFEERMLLDDLQETDRQLKGSPRSLKQRKKLQLSKDKAIRDLQIQYERERERNLFGERKRDYRRQVDVPRYNHSTDPKAQQLAESHGRNMEQLQNRNRDLERQREEIRRRLEELGRRPIKDDDSMNALLQELKDQEARNQKMLEELRRLMATQYNYPIPVEAKKQQQYIYPIYYGNSLVAEIIAVRQAYLQNGGNDPSILQQLAQMQAEAQAIDDSLRNRPPPKQKDKHHPDHTLLTLELENERLQRQLLLLQEQNLQAKQRRKDDREGRVVIQRRRATTTIRDVQPLDTRLLTRAKTKPSISRLVVLREKPVTLVHSLKERIDSDVQNKFGYDLGTSRYVIERYAEPEEKPQNQTNRADVSIVTMLPEGAGDTVPVRPHQYPQTIPEVNEDARETPYFKNHLTSRKLNEIEKNLRDSYSRNSLPNAKGEDIERLDRLQAQKREHDPDLKLNLNSLASPRHPNPSQNNPAQVDDSNLKNSVRSQIDEPSYSKRDRPPPHPRPQLLVNEAPEK